MKHIDFQYFIQFVVQEGKISLIYCPTNSVAAAQAGDLPNKIAIITGTFANVGGRPLSFWLFQHSQMFL